ncbi:MAG: glycosyltransferase [Bacteroidia bacterium]|nr:glycosyltransferase [Bacteroidia bacterium]
MKMVELIFWVSLLLMLHSYVIYPLILHFLGRRKKININVFSQNDDLPNVAILLAVHNEEEVIEEKIKSTFDTNYPLEKLELLIGSDNSTDNTNSIVQSIGYQNNKVKLYEHSERQGKAEVIYNLSQQTDTEILILTDANVIFQKDTILELTKHFKNNKIGLVAGNIINKEHKLSGISLQEKSYLVYEKRIKFLEGVVWGTMIGAFGGCYAIRKENYARVPEKFLMDDFYISMNVLKQGKKTIQEMNAVCWEDVSDKISEEFRRKVRISAGNFQNLSVYKSLLWPPFSKVSFSFFSHKVIRWIGPFLLLIMLASCFLLSKIFDFYLDLLAIQLCLIALVVFDLLLKILNIHLKLLRFASHFYLMNLALLVGFVKYLKGVETNVWKPTLRNQ